MSATTKSVQGATLVYASQLGALPQSALLWEPTAPGEPLLLAKLHKSVFSIKLTLEPHATDLYELQKRLVGLYKKHILEHDKRLESEQLASDARLRLTKAELAHPAPEERWLTIQSVDPQENTYTIQCSHHGVFMGLLYVYCTKQWNGGMPLWIDNVKHLAQMSTLDQPEPLRCNHKGQAPGVVAEALLGLFGRRGLLDSGAVALPAYTPRQSAGVQWTILDDYLALPHPVQVRLDQARLQSLYTVTLPQTLHREDDEGGVVQEKRSLIRSTAEVRVLGLACPLVRVLVASSSKAHSIPNQTTQKGDVVGGTKDTEATELNGSKANAPVALVGKKRPRENESAHLRPKRIKSLATQIPYLLFLKQWSDLGSEVASKRDTLDPELIEAWCLLGQPKRAAMGEERVRFLAQRATEVNNGILPHWFRPGV